jgi:hydroxyacylglutathione hydrolase
MKLTKINDNISFLKGSRSSNIYYLDFEKKAIIDSGHPGEIEYNMNVFRENGVNLEKIDYIINTHSHGDHVGGNAYLKSLNPDLKILCSEYKDSFQKSRRSFDFLKKVEDDFVDFDTDILLKDNDRIDLGDCMLEVIETKGHTRDSMSFYLEEKGYLFSGDTVYYHIITQVDYYQDLGKSVEELEHTYERIKDLQPLKIFTGHGEPIDDPSANSYYCLKKLKRFNPEMLIINNFIPALEFYIYRYKGCSKSELKAEIMTNLMGFKNSMFLTGFDEGKFEGIFEKMYSLMKLLNYFEESDGRIYLKRNPNDYLSDLK